MSNRPTQSQLDALNEVIDTLTREVSDRQRERLQLIYDYHGLEPSRTIVETQKGRRGLVLRIKILGSYERAFKGKPVIWVAWFKKNGQPGNTGTWLYCMNARDTWEIVGRWEPIDG